MKIFIQSIVMDINMKIRLYSYLTLLLSVFALTACLEEDTNNAIGTPSPIISIEDIRSFYKGSDVTLSRDKLLGAQQVIGVVISDATGQNVPGGSNSVVIQNHRRGQIRGILLNFDGAANLPYNVGDSVVVQITGTTLTKSSGMLQISGLSAGDIVKVAEDSKVHLREVTLEDLAMKADEYEGTLVRVVAGNISPLPAPTATFSGDKIMSDGSNNVYLHTEPNAAFSNRRVYASASYTGIPVAFTSPSGTGEEALMQFWIRTIDDVKDPSGPIYTGFPESFEAVPQETKPSYNMTTIDNNIVVASGEWKLYQAILGNTPGRDRFTGSQGVRMQQQLDYDTYTQMNFDVPDGASKVTMLYGSYYNDASSSWRLEYSQDEGTTWTQIGETVTDASKEAKTAVFLMDISGPVRFRVVKLGLGKTTATVQNGRLCFDDIAVYSN